MKELIEDSDYKRSRYKVNHKTATGMYPRMERRLVAWFTELRANNKVVSGLMIKKQALSLFDEVYGRTSKY